ncbi:MAG: universal stress protein F [Paracoccaceae bacterium]|jgi:universal stress protein F
MIHVKDAGRGVGQIGAAPVPRRARKAIMYSNILIPIAGDTGVQTDDVIAIARAIAAPGAKLTLMHVVERVPSYVASQIPPELLGRASTESKEMLAAVAARTGADMAQAVITGHGARSILEFAEDNGSDCIVMRSHRPEFQDVFFGSTAAHVVRHATCSVHVIR